MRDTGAGGDARARQQQARRAAARRQQRAQDARTLTGALTSPLGPPPRPPSPAQRVQAKIANRMMDRATNTGRPLSNWQAQQALKRYGFKGATRIEGIIRTAAQQRVAENLARSGFNVQDIAHGGHYEAAAGTVHGVAGGQLERTGKGKLVWRKPPKSLIQDVSTMGVVPGTNELSRLVNLVTSFPRDAAIIGIGTGQLAARLGYDITVDTKNLLSGHPSARALREAKKLGVETVSSYRQRYGSDVQQQLAEHPLSYLLDAWLAAGAATRVGSVTRGALEARSLGVSPLKAIQQGWWKSRNQLDPRLYIPGEGRTLPLGGRRVPIQSSRSPLGRYFQRVYDDYSRLHPDLPKIGLKPRAARAAVKQLEQQNVRERARFAGDVRAVRHPGGRFPGKEASAADLRLFWEGNLPPELRGPGNQGLQQLHDYLTKTRDSPMRLRELEPTANLLAARARVERLTGRYEKAVAARKESIGKELAKANGDLRAAEDSVSVLTRRKEEFAADPHAAATKARTRLEEINASLDKVVAHYEAELKAQLGGKFTAAESMRRTKYKREAAGPKGVSKPKQLAAKFEQSHYKGMTQAQENRAYAIEKMQQLAAKDTPAGRAVKSLVDEQGQLSDMLDAYDQQFLFKAPEPAAPTVSKAEATRRLPENLPSNLGRRKYAGEPGRLGGALSVSADELQALERRHLNRIGQSHKQLQSNLNDAQVKLGRMNPDTKSYAAQEARVARLQDAVDRAEQFVAGHGWLRHEQLTRRIAELEKAMAHTPDDRYHQALAGAAALTSDITDVARRVMGDEYVDQVFPQRLALVPRMMGHEELLPSDIFAPHREVKAGRAPGGGFGGGPRGRTVKGEQAATALGFTQKNRGILLESGRVDPDLEHLVVQWGRSQAWKFNQDIKDLAWDAGEPITAGTLPRAGWYVINRSGKPTPRIWDSAEASDEALTAGLEDFVRNSIITPDRVSQTPLDHVNMRQVDPQTMDAILRESGVAKPQPGAGTQAFDIVNGIVRTSLLYANPGYYPANFIGNLIFLGLHQMGFALPNLYRAGHSFMHNRELFDAVASEVGMGPTEALAAGRAGIGRLGRIRAIERRVTHVAAAIPDVWPRAAAWFHEARSAGFKTDQAMIDLLRSTDPSDMAIRQQLSDRATNIMVNFDRLSPAEQSTLGRVFFVWPWIRGASAWAGHYMKEYPERTGVIAPLATQENRQDLQPYGPAGLPAYLANLVPLNAAGTHVLNIGSISPTATAAQLIGTSAGLINSAFTDAPMPKYLGIGDMANPLIDFIWYTAHGQTQFGQEVGLQTAFKQNIVGLSALARTGLQATGRLPVSPIYTDQSAAAVLKRSWGRVLPFDVNKKAIAERAKMDQPGPSATPETRMDDWIKETGQLLGPVPESVRRARRSQMLVEEAAAQYKKKTYGSTRHSLDDRETAAVLLSVDAQQHAGSWTPENLQAVQQMIRTGPPDAVRQLTTDIRNSLYGNVLRQVNTDRAAEKRRREAATYAKSH